jgi:hypothetical protein
VGGRVEHTSGSPLHRCRPRLALDLLANPVVFFAGVLRVPASVLQLAGDIPAQGPPWYVVLRAVVGLTLFLIALVMLAGYRKGGMWGSP